MRLQMKIALAQLNYHIGNFEANLDKMSKAIVGAKSDGADLIVFAELAVCGYPPRDFLEFDDFLARCKHSIDALTKLSDGIGIIVGAPSANPKIEGKNLFNSAFLLADGKIKSMHSKALLPTYDVFDEYRYFEPSTQQTIAEFKGTKIAITICEDLWDVYDDKLYTLDPMAELKKQGAELMINIAASPFNYKQAETRREIMQRNVLLHGIPLLYVNHVGAQTELIFDGGSMTYNAKGNLTFQLPFFSEHVEIIDTTSIGDTEVASPLPETVSCIYQALVLGVSDYFTKLKFPKAILGLSGGIDSAVTLAIVAEALGAENVMAVLLPSQFSSQASIDDALEMVGLVGCKYEIMAIEPSYKAIYNSLPEAFKQSKFDIAEENLQARIRATLLMALANKNQYILLNTSNKSEAAVGYGTLYGDMSGGLSVLGDVYKTQVYELAEHINSEKKIIPTAIIEKVPSAELRPNQKDSDSLPEYAILDQILFHYIEERQGPKELVALGFDEQLVDRVLKLVNTSEFKRAQSPPILRVSSKAFGMGRKMPIVGKYLS